MNKDIDALVYKSVFDKDKKEYRKILRKEAKRKGLITTTLYDIYKRIAKGEFSGFTIPAFNLRTLTYDLARAIFRAAKRSSTGLFIFELARQEMEYTGQSFEEYVTCILSAALREEFYLPIFVQADHVQVSRKGFMDSPEAEFRAIKNLIRDAISAGIYNIDIDASTLVDFEEDSESEQQRNNFKITAQLIKFIRKIQPENITINIGGEIGEIGDKNSTPDDLCAFMEGLKGELKRDYPGISKISIQTGTTHGGVVLPNGKIADIEIDFETIKKLASIARDKYGLAGVVQHGASTLPLEIFSKFPTSGCIEIHLATGIQNIFFEKIPEELRKNISDFIVKKYQEEEKKYKTIDQFFYKTRKFALGEFKEEIWSLPEEEKNRVAGEVERWAFKIFNLLKVNNKRNL